MAAWLISVVVSWLAGAGAAALVTWGHLFGGRFLPIDYRRAELQATAVHVAACAVLYLGVVKALQARVSRGAMTAITTVLGMVPLAAVLMWREGTFEAARRAMALRDNWIFAVFFIVAGGAFGLLFHARDPRIAALEHRLHELERERGREPTS